MANAYAEDVVRYFRRKGSSGFTEPIAHIGSEQRYVTGLRNSSVNNLEEQYLLGTDVITEISEDENGNKVIEKSYYVARDGVTPNNYYKVIYTLYKDYIENADPYFDGVKIVLPAEVDTIYPSNFVITERQELVFIVNGNSKPVLTKLIKKKYDNNLKKVTTKEEITNFIA